MGLENLEHIDLSQNNIESIPDNLFCPIKTSFTLNLSDNAITSGKLGDCKLNITTLDVSFNDIRTISQSFVGHLSGLTEFNAKGNTIEAVDKFAFRGLTLLESIDLSHNKLTALPAELFTDNTRLHYIDLSTNNIGTMNATIFRYQTLTLNLELIKMQFLILQQLIN